MKKSPLNKSRKKIAQDYARNAMYDKKHGYKKEGKYEAKQAVRAASGAPVRMESSAQEKKNLLQDMPVDKKASALNNLNKGYGSQVKSPMSMYGKKSPAKMGHSPMKMGHSPMKMQGSFMSKHSQSHMAKSSPLHRQGYNDRLDESLGAKNGKKSQSLKDRRDESKGMEKSKGKGAYSSDSKMS
tara:strand:- start:4067 stop:4618 length:552 start_codon:yes stop_codon:yes gene_type:complete